MSTTMTMTLSTAAETSCPSCGQDLPHSGSSTAEIGAEAQKQIEDLQAQVRMLTQKATAAVDKWADYEDEIQNLRLQLVPPEPAPSPIQNRFSSFLSPRKSYSNLRPPSIPPPSTPREADLAAALNREQVARQAAEGKLNDASGELEDLTAQLFQQANEMVATERKARAKLEERVAMLERRDGEKRARLEKLEKAVGRIERVKGLLNS
ncbi:ribosomal protein L32 [Phlyctema vagabunda]|uniref:Ribosomal protein L32 n=1 Tax=Phlyctema vagabunda TaxID=108571 RepID=A0ABR4P3Q6_9HELO